MKILIGGNTLPPPGAAAGAAAGVAGAAPAAGAAAAAAGAAGADPALAGVRDGPLLVLRSIISKTKTPAC